MYDNYVDTLYRPSQKEIIPIDNVIDKCILMDMTKSLGLVFVSHFPNHIELE